MLKLTAIILMLIDHFAVALLPPTTVLYWICRIIGRLAMPIFCYKLAIGFIHTRHLPQYFGRILLMTLAAQIPFGWLCFGLGTPSLWLTSWNVGLTFLCGLALLWCYKTYRSGSSYRQLALLPMPLLLYLSLNGDYGLYGVLLIVLFYIDLTYDLGPTTMTSLVTLLTVVFYGLLGGSLSLCLLQLCALGGLVCIRLIPDQKTPYLPASFFYVFYPLHMLLLALIRDIFVA